MFRILLAWFAISALGSLPAAGADLAIQRLALHDYEDGPLTVPGYEYLPGEVVWFSARLTGYSREVIDDDAGLDHVRLTWQVRPSDPAGTLIVPPLRGVLEETLRPEDKTWTPKFVVSFELPSYAPRGTYKIPVVVRDDIAKSEVTGQMEFRVRGEDAPAADAPLSLRNFRFLAKEEDRFPLREPAYKQGASLFTRFDIIGYKFEGNNHFAVEYGLAILTPPNAEGVSRLLFQQETAAAETGESFYPQRWIPGGFKLDLDPDVPTGEYTLVLTVRDKVGGNAQEFRQPFRVE